MSQFLAYLTVFLAAAVPWLEVLLVVPAGIVAGLPSAPVAVVAALGNVATLVPLVLGGDRLRAWWRRRRARRRGDADTDLDGQAPSARSGRAARLFERYGLPGLAALGPLVTGIHVAAVVALTAGAERRRTLVWLSAGVVVWSALAAGATVLGVDALIDRDQVPDLGL